MKYTVEVKESIEGVRIKILGEKGKVEGSLCLPLNGPYKYNGAFQSQEIELCQNSIHMIPGTSYVHNIYIEKKESGNIYRSNKRETLITLVPCNKLYLNGSLYYGYEICTEEKEIIIPIYKNKEGDNSKNEEYQVGLIKPKKKKHHTKIYTLITSAEDALANVIMFLYCYMLSTDKYESDYKISTDNALLSKYSPEFEKIWLNK